jgi:hypothetical protein
MEEEARTAFVPSSLVPLSFREDARVAEFLHVDIFSRI